MSRAKVDKTWWEYLGIVLLVILGISGLVMVAMFFFFYMAMANYGSNK